MNKILTVFIALGLLGACGQQSQTSSKDQQIAENQKQIEILKQQAEIQRLQNELNTNAVASAVGEVYQLVASEVAATLPENLQAQAKQTGQPVRGTDGQQYMYDPDTGNWLLYGAIGAAMGYLAANAMNNRNAAKYQPVQKPTAAVQRVYKDYRAANPNMIPAPKAQSTQNGVAQQKATPNYRQTQQGYSNHKPRRGFGRRR
ncbi:MAG: hypothetical protein Q4B82_07125 [Alysiella sp.]|uniref:hypothetical protein n=1 Tax=Alysiella sp. TaxID=1872483 RepID=UPI0026DD7D44|nr:hypothetical protein [Alysiella sp.]MDO4434333.1 hypothetical protein [Alysiella sp.]